MNLYRAYIFDLDGTIYRGKEALPHAVEVVAELQARGAQVFYLTNNAGETRAFFTQKLSNMGFRVKPEEIHSSATGTADHLVSVGARSAYAIGMPGLVQTLRDAGIAVVNVDDNGVVGPNGVQADVVVVGICRSLTYDLLDYGLQQIIGGAKFVATNRDATFPLEGGRISPGAGTMVAAMQACSGVEPFVVGKPNPYLVELILKQSGLPAADVVVIGDRPDTDLECGAVVGCPTHLVLTGVTKTPPPGQAFSEDLRGLL